MTYDVVVDRGASDLAQPLVNVATIDSDQTPRITPPPTDTVLQTPSNPGYGLMLTLLALAGLTLAVGVLTPAPARARRSRSR